VNKSGIEFEPSSCYQSHYHTGVEYVTISSSKLYCLNIMVRFCVGRTDLSGHSVHINSVARPVSYLIYIRRSIPAEEATEAAKMDNSPSSIADYLNSWIYIFTRPYRDHCKQTKQTPWPLVRKRTIPTERPPLVGKI
jgi:hypothetical protein